MFFGFGGGGGGGSTTRMFLSVHVNFESMRNSKDEDIRELYEAGKDLIFAGTISEIKSSINRINNIPVVKKLTALDYFNSAYKDIKKGLVFLLVPAPTTADDLKGVALITRGIITGAYGIAMTIVAWSEKK